jgi:predicted polyphosphate/ATP-dependent NAD kinase
MNFSTRPRLGLIVNPVAGMGGSVGLKGTDGELVLHARERGAKPVAAGRAIRALQQLVADAGRFELLTCAGEMGETAARAAGLEPRIAYRPAAENGSSAADTRAAVARMIEAQVALLLFAGGDGTACEVMTVAGTALPVLGIPAGVKMHSAVFAVTAKTAGDVARRYLAARDFTTRDPAHMLALAEVMDRAETPDGEGGGSPVLHGYLRIPRVPFLTQATKSASPASDLASLEGACRRAAELARATELAIIGPGSTMQRVKQLLGVEGTLLGVDAFVRGRCVATDAGERQLLELLAGGTARIFVTVVGGQGFLFGRGNQQISAQVLRRVGRDNIVVVSSVEKLLALPGGSLRVDTGAEDVDAALAGQLLVITGADRQVVCRLGDDS